MVGEKHRLTMDGNRDEAFSTEGVFNWKEIIQFLCWFDRCCGLFLDLSVSRYIVYAMIQLWFI